eukprot:g1451.t1
MADEGVPDAPSAAHEPAVPAWAAQLSAASNYVATIQYLQSKAPQKKRHFYADNDELSLRPWSEDMLTCVELLKKSHASVPAEEDDIVVAQLKPFILRAAENTQKVAKRVYRSLRNGESPHCADDMITNGARLVTQMWTRNDPCLCNLGNLLSDMSTTYYKGSYDAYRRTWLNSNAFTGLRIHKYLLGRYDDIVATLCADKWVGVEAARYLLSTLNNLGPLTDDGKQQQPRGVDRERAHAAALTFMERVKHCLSSDLKMKFKRNERSLKPLFFQLERLAGTPPERPDDVVPWFWLEHIDLKYLKSENLQERLFAAGEFAWFARHRASNLEFEHRALQEDTFVEWLNRHRVFESIFDSKLMHPEVIRRGKQLCGWLAHRERYGIEGSFPPSRLESIWDYVVSGTPENSKAAIEIFTHCTSCLPKEYLPRFFQSEAIAAAVQDHPSGSRLRLVDLLLHFSEDNAATPAITAPISIRPVLSLLWKLIWHPCYVYLPPDGLTSLFQKIMRYQGAEPFRDKYVHTCLGHISAKDCRSPLEVTNDNAAEKEAKALPAPNDDLPRQLAFRLLQVVVRTMDIVETEKVIDQIEEECDDFLQMLIDELCQFAKRASMTRGSFDDGVLDRLGFLSLVLKQSRLDLTANNIRSLYDSSTSSRYVWVDKLWRWLKRLVTGGNCLQMSECRAAFMLMCKLDPSTMSKSQWLCWEVMFVHCNSRHIVVKNKSISRVETPKLVGFDYLWRIATETGDGQSSFVSSMSRDLYLQVLKSISEPGDTVLIVHTTINPDGKDHLVLFRDLSRSQPFKGENKTLAALGIKDGDTIIVSKSSVQHPVETEDERDPEDTDATSPWDDMVRDKRFSLVFKLFSKMTRYDASNKVWEFLQSMPTDALLLRQLQSPYILHRAPWDVWFSDPISGEKCKSTYTRAVYVMQILDSMLMPADGDSDSEAVAAIWRKNFLQSSGFSFIIDFLMKHSGGEKNIVSRTGLSLVIRLSQFFLLGMLSAKGIRVTDDRESHLSHKMDLHMPYNESSPHESDTDSVDDTVNRANPENNTSIDEDYGNKREHDVAEISTITKLASKQTPPLLRSFSVDSADLVCLALESGSLLEKLIKIVFCEQFTPESGDRTEILVTTFVLIEGVLRLKKDHIRNVLSIPPHDTELVDDKISANPKTGLFAVLLREPAPRVRKIMIVLLQFIAKSFRDVFSNAVEMIISTLKQLDLQDTAVASSCEDFFELTESIFAQVDARKLPVYAQPIIDKLHELALQHSHLEPFTGVRELTNPQKNPEQIILTQFLKTLAGILQRCPHLAEDLGEEHNPFITDIIEHYLFKIGTFEDQTGAICFTPGSREAAFDVLRIVAVANQQNLKRVLFGIRSFSNSISPKTDRNIDPELYKKSSAGYAGIQNQGNTSSSREEPFVTLSLDIAGKSSIIESLESWVEGERMEGQNQLDCDFLPLLNGKTQKVDGLRRTCISKLPNTLIIHLKRFGIDYTTFTPYKINTHCEFPDILDMHKYTAEYLSDMESVTVVKPGAKDSVTENDAEQDSGRKHDAFIGVENCMYKLSGVVVHQGAAGGGHYWSLARSEDGTWVKFDDITVTSFSEANFGEETYGGSYEMQTRNQLGELTTKSVDRIKSAYILYYTRIIPAVPDDNRSPENNASEVKQYKGFNESKEFGKSKESKEGSEDENVCASRTTTDGDDEADTSIMLNKIMHGLRVASGSIVRDNEKLHGLREWAPEVWKENSRVQRKRYLYNSNFFEFVSELAITYASSRIFDTPSASAEQQKLHADFTMYAYSILLEVVMCSKYKGNIISWIVAMRGLLEGHSDLCARIVAKTADNLLTRLLLGNDKNVRKVYGRIISFAVTQLSERACQDDDNAKRLKDVSDRFVKSESGGNFGASKSFETATTQQMGYEDSFMKYGTGALPALLQSLIRIQDYVMRKWENSESYLQLYMNMIAGPPHIQQALIQQDTISAMCNLYLGSNSTITNMPELPTWGSLNKYSTVDAPNLSQLVLIINRLVNTCPNGVNGIPKASFEALHQPLLVKKAILSNPTQIKTLLPILVQDNDSLTLSSIEAILSASSRSKSSAEELVELLVAMLSVEDCYTSTRLKYIFAGMETSTKSIKGLIQRAKSKTKMIQRPHAAKSAYKIIKIISLLDKQYPPAKEWLVSNRATWVPLVNWLHTESYETSLNGNRDKLLRCASTEETVLSLAVTGDVALAEQKKAVVGGPVIDRDGNAQFGWWRGIRTANNYYHTGFTDTARAIFPTPCPEDGHIREVRLLMASNAKGIHDDKPSIQDDEYFIEVFNSVDNDMEANIASGLDITPQLVPESPAGTMFKIGDKLDCAAPHQGASEPMSGFVTRVTLNDEGLALYDLVYENGRCEIDVQEFLCAKSENETSSKQKCYAFQLVSTTPVPGVRLCEEGCQRFLVDIQVSSGQYIGIRSKSGKLNIYHREVVDSYATGGRSRGIQGLIFTRAQTGTESSIGHIEYNMVPDSKAKWGFAATVQYNSVLGKDSSDNYGAAQKISLSDTVSLDPENYFSTKVSSEADEDEWMDISYDRSYVARHYHEQELDDSYFERLD